MSDRRRLSVLSLVLAALVVVGVIAVAGRGQSQPSAALSPAAVKAALAGSPAVLAALHAQAGRLLGGGTKGFDARLRQLRGYPIVINKWASWCGPCKTEFPAYQRASAALGRKVAFLGIDGQDSAGAAAKFLRRFPVSYPSYSDPRAAIANALQATTFFPETVYIDRGGTEVYDHAGPYDTAAALEKDIRRYVLR